MSNAIANSDASKFENSAGLEFVRGDDLKGERENLSFPSVETLIAETLPFTSSADLLQRLLNCWRKTFALNECAFLWHEDSSSIGHLAILNESGDFELLQFQIPVDVKELNQAAYSKYPHIAQWHWLSLECKDSINGRIGFDESVNIEFPVSWMTATSKLFATALAWEQTLTENKLKALGEYAAGAGHEINNPLAAINGRSAQLLQQESDSHRKHLLQTIGAQTYRIRDMIGDSMLFARPPALQLSIINLSDLIERVVHKFVEQFATRNLSLWGNREQSLRLRADETQLSIVVSELIRNSINAVEDGGRIEIDCYSKIVNEQDFIVLRVADNGAGFTAEEREHCFDPFYSGRQAGRGLGFGLSKCWRIVTEHQGRIVLNEISGELTEFVITLPADLSID